MYIIMWLKTIAYGHNNELLIIIHMQYSYNNHVMSCLKFNFSHCLNSYCHLATHYSLYIILFTSVTKAASYLTPIIQTFRNLSKYYILSEGILSRYTLLLSQLDVQSHPMLSVGDL